MQFLFCMNDTEQPQKHLSLAFSIWATSKTSILDYEILDHLISYKLFFYLEKLVILIFLKVWSQLKIYKTLNQKITVAEVLIKFDVQ